MSEDKSANFARYMSNPRSFTLKKWLAEVLREDYPPFDTIAERIAVALTTDQDVKEFGQLITHVYERAYRKAVADYKEQAEKLGLTVTITAGEPTQTTD